MLLFSLFSSSTTTTNDSLLFLVSSSELVNDDIGPKNEVVVAVAAPAVWLWFLFKVSQIK